MRIIDQAGLGYAYGASLLAYLADGAPRPFSASFSVTNQCNIRCSYCNCPALDPKSLDLKQIETLFRRLHEMGVRRLGLAGGEPLLRKDIGKIVRLAKGLGMFVTMNTNLMLYQRDPSAVEEVDIVFTSLDGDAVHHNRNRGEGAYAGVLQAIEALRRLGKPVVAICVVTEHNLDQAGWLLDQAERVDFRVHFQPQCTDAVIVRGGLSEAASNDSFRAFWRGLSGEKKRGRPIASSTAYLEFLSEWKDFRISSYTDPETKCAAGLGFLSVDPLGDAYPCAYTKGKVAPINLLSENWREAFGKTTPCTNCSVGPMLEFNLLFRNPIGATIDALRSYVRWETRPGGPNP